MVIRRAALPHTFYVSVFFKHITINQWFSIGGTRTPRGCKKGFLGVGTSLILQKIIHQMVQGVQK